MSLPRRLLDVIDLDILPLTEAGVAAGNKVFGAALLRKSDLSVVIAGTNNETTNPLLHGEISTLTQFYELPNGRRLPTCCSSPPTNRARCACPRSRGRASTISTTSSPTRIPATLRHSARLADPASEVFGVEPGGYRRSNAFWTAYSIPVPVDAEPEPLRTKLRAQQVRITRRATRAVRAVPALQGRQRHSVELSAYAVRRYSEPPT